MRGLVVDEEVPVNVDVSMGYAAVGMAECLEAVHDVDEKSVNADLQVRSSSPSNLA